MLLLPLYKMKKKNETLRKWFPGWVRYLMFVMSLFGVYMRSRFSPRTLRRKRLTTRLSTTPLALPGSMSVYETELPKDYGGQDCSYGCFVDLDST